MNMRDKSEGSTLTMMEAVETLSAIADLEFGQEGSEELPLQTMAVKHPAAKWLRVKDEDLTVEDIKETFRVVLNYLRHFYKKKSGYFADQSTVEGIKTIMVLVGEAASKLDKYTTLFHHTHGKSVTELKEYRQLQEFYLSRVARKIDAGLLGKWILAISQRSFREAAQHKEKALQGIVESPASKHVFVDLDSVKKDAEYELFFLRKEDGNHFFSPRLIRNITLVCDFGSSIGEIKGEDPLFDVVLWQDKMLQTSARSILQNASGIINEFCKDVGRLKDYELVNILNKSIIALILAANPSYLMKNVPPKCCSQYFDDFYHFFREALTCADYNKLIAYPPKKSNHVANTILKLIEGLGAAVFLSSRFNSEVSGWISSLVDTARQGKTENQKNNQTIASTLSSDYVQLSKMLRVHSNGPLIKVLDILQEGIHHVFDPLIQHNIPTPLFEITNAENDVLCVRMPCPTCQEFIHKAAVVEEFKSFLRQLKHHHKRNKMLVLNLQDRTSWKEHARCIAIEELQTLSEFSGQLNVVTIPKDTEFYHQLPPYQDDNHTDIFIQHLKEHVEDEGCGFYFPDQIKNALIPAFLDRICDSIHHFFFGGKNVLTHQQRLDFIEIFYTLLQLKIMEIVNPQLFSFLCKDGVDTGETASVQMYLFLMLLNHESLSFEDMKLVREFLYIPSILLRERTILVDRFQRMINAIKVIESLKSEKGFSDFSKEFRQEFGKLFKTKLLFSQCLPFRPSV